MTLGQMLFWVTVELASIAGIVIIVMQLLIMFCKNEGEENGESRLE